MKEYKLTISTPDGSYFQGNVVALYVDGTEGQLAVLAGHTPFITVIKEGDVRIELENTTERTGTIQGGILTVDKNNVTVLSSTFSWK
ncbi:MAG: F0F1 ATP synthase subunit epsilon [Clostridia bacterium]|nr:F0F1 ATP synthase subunit epsilon [Clostridia bacterium]